MKSEQITTLAVTAAGAGGLWYLSGDKFNEGGAPVDRGSLSWSSQFDYPEDADYIFDLSGGKHTIGSYGAVNAAYDTAAEYARLLSRYTQIVERALAIDPSARDRLYQGFLTTGRFSISQNTSEAQQIQIANMVSAAVNFGVSLRILSMMYESAEVSIPYRPARWVRRGVDLSRIAFGSFLNPLAAHDPSRGGLEARYNVTEIRRHEAWNTIGIEIVTSWLRAYVDIDRIPGIRDLLAEIQDDLTPPAGTEPVVMGAWGAILWGVGKLVALVVGSYVGYRVIMATLAGASHFLGYNYHYLQAIGDAYDRSLDCCYDTDLPPEEREACCQEARRLADDISSYKVSWSGMIRVGLIGGLAFGGYLVYRRFA